MGVTLLEILNGLKNPGILTIKDLKNLDDAELKAVIEAQIPLKSEHDEAA